MIAKKKSQKELDPKLVGIFDDMVDPAIVAEIKEAAENPPEPRETPRALIMFWRKTKCSRCKKTYEAPAYGADVMVQLVREKPIMHFGRFFGWKFVGIHFQQVPDLSCYDFLPRQVEYIHSTIRNCPRCVNRPNVIYLEDGND